MLEEVRDTQQVKDWLDGYDRSIEGPEKKKYLDMGLEIERSPENLLRQTLWEYRFTKDGKLTGHDQFMALWMELSFNEQRLKGFLGKGMGKRNVRQIHDKLMLSKAAESEGMKDVLYREYLNLCSVYIYLCQSDKGYRSVVLGLGSVDDATLQRKIANDVYGVTFGVPLLADMTEEFKLFSEAGHAAYLRAFPEGEAVWETAAAKFRNRNQ